MEPCSIATAAGGLSWIFWTAVGGTLGNWSDRQFCAVVVDLKERLSGLSGLPANHDVARAVRVAQLQALHRSIQDFADLQVPVIGRVLLRGEPDVFIAEARHYCTQSITRVHDNDASFDRDLTSTLVDAIDEVLAAPEHDGPGERRARTIGAAVESRVLAELAAALAPHEFPDGFVQHFRTGTHDEKQRFLELFGAYISEELKQNERFRDIFTTGQLANLRTLARETHNLVACLEARFGEVFGHLEETLQQVRAAQFEHLAQLQKQGQMIADLHARLAPAGLTAWADAAGTRPLYRSGPGESDAERPSARAASSSAVSNIPFVTPKHFVGRDEDIDRIERDLTRYAGRVAILAINGMRGSGKSTLAMAYAERHRHRYHATWWIRAATEHGIRTDLVALATQLGWAALDEREDYPVHAVLDRLQGDGDGLLLIYDNAVDAETVEPYLPRSGAAHVLITSNARAWRQVAEPIDLLLWPDSVGAEFLIARTGHQHERHEAERLSEACEGLPLALEVAASYCEQVGISLAEYRRRFDREGVRLIDKGVSPRSFHDRLSVTKAFQLAIGEAAQRHASAEPLIVHAALLAAEPIPTCLFDEGASWFDEPLASSLGGGGLDAIVGALRTFALVDRLRIPDERQPAVQTDCIRLHRLVRDVAGLHWPEDARTRARRALIAAMASVYPPDDVYALTLWPKARRLDPLASALVGGDTEVPAGSELPAAELMCKLGAYRHGSTAEYAQAQALFSRALSIRERALGPDDPAIPACLNNLALLSWAQGDLDEARALAERALAQRERTHGPSHVDVAQSLITLARIRREQREVDVATGLCHRALAIYLRTAGPDHPDVALCKSTLVRVLLIDGDLAVAEPLSRDAARIYEQALGPDHPALAASLINLATVLQRQGRSGEAVPLVERAVAIHEAVLGPIHSTVASTLFRLASLIEDMGDYVRARPLVERALDINVRTLGSDHPISASVRGHLEQLTAAAS